MKLVSDNSADQSIGLFDSGLGGLTVLREMRAALPGESFVYLGDTARTPYGSKGAETIIRYARECSAFLESSRIKMLIVACNTVSSIALGTLSEEMDCPVIGTVMPAVSQALRVTKRGRIGVIGTKATIKSQAYQSRLSEADRSLEIFSQACPLFVPLVEEGLFDGPIVEQIVDHYLSPLRQLSIDTLVLGCTHYPLLIDAIGRYFGPEVAIVECSKAVASEASAILSSRGIQRRQPMEGENTRFFVTDEVGRFNTLAGEIVGALRAEKVDIGEDRKRSGPPTRSLA